MVLATFAFAIMTALIRFLAEDLHPFQIAFFRNLFGFLFMLPWLMRAGMGALRTTRMRLYWLRAAFALAAMLCWFSGLALMPLAEATALSFSAPLFATLAAIVVLGERLGPHRTIALISGLAGALIILRPGLAPVGLPALLILASSVFIACAITTVKILARTEGTSAIVTWMVIYLIPLSLVPALFVWTWPDLDLLGWLFALGAAATVGQVAMTRAYAAADATVVLPLDYTRLPFVALIGWVAFAETVDVWTWVGAAVMATATIYMTYRETRYKRRTRIRENEKATGGKDQQS